MSMTGMCPECQRWLTQAEPFCPVHGIAAAQIPSLPQASPPIPPQANPPVVSSTDRGSCALIGFLLGGVGLIVGLVWRATASDDIAKSKAEILIMWGLAGAVLAAIVCGAIVGSTFP